MGLVGCIDEVAHNAIAVYWNPLESSAKVSSSGVVQRVVEGKATGAGRGLFCPFKNKSQKKERKREKECEMKEKKGERSMI